MKKRVLILFFPLILLSCEKEKPIIVENTGIPLLIRILYDGEIGTVYSYNEANLVTEEKSKFNYIGHNYNDNNLLITSEFYIDELMFSSSSYAYEAAMNRKEWVNPENTEKSLTQTFRYNDKEQLIRIIYTRPGVEQPEFLEYTWENDKIIRQTMYWSNRITGYIDYFYDETGNLIRQERYDVFSDGTHERSTTTEYEFDKMHNPFQAFKRLMIPGKYTNPNNILKETYTIHFEVDPWVEKVQTSEYSYIYNDLGYPVKVGSKTEYLYK